MVLIRKSDEKKSDGISFRWLRLWLYLGSSYWIMFNLKWCSIDFPSMKRAKTTRLHGRTFVFVERFGYWRKWISLLMCFRFYFPVKNKKTQNERKLCIVCWIIVNFIWKWNLFMHFQFAIKTKAYGIPITLLVVASNRKHNSFSTAFNLTSTTKTAPFHCCCSKAKQSNKNTN